MAQEVLSFVLSANIEVVGILIKEESEHYVLSKARSLMMSQTQDGSVSMGLLPFMASANNPETGSESDIILHKCHIMGQAVETPESLAKWYLQSVTGIAIIQ